MVSIKSIWESHVPTDEIIIKTQLEHLKPFKCFAATNHITGNHLYIFETSKNAKFPEFKNFKFKGLFIEIFEFEDTKELHIYLLDNQLKDIFSLFIENIVEEISKSVTENEALVETSNVVLKWKKLFDKINFQGLTIERQKGLIGELLLFNSLLDEEYSIDIGDTVLVDDQHNVHPLRARNINDSEVETIFFEVVVFHFYPFF